MIPDLPDGHWSADVHQAFDNIDGIVNTGIDLLAHENVESIRLSIAASNLERVLPFREGLLASGLDQAWVEETMAICEVTMNQLLRAADELQPK
jgi:hypothetical protein